MIEIKTQIGYGCPDRQGKAKAHGEPLGADNVAATRAFLGWEYPAFELPEELYDYTATLVEHGAQQHAAWQEMMQQYAQRYPQQAELYARYMSGEVDTSFMDDPAFWAFEGANATRNTSGEVLKRLMAYVPNFIGGSADLAPSTKAVLPGRGDFTAETPQGANMHFGVRELAMAAICNGIAAHGGLRPFCATFFVFSDYVKPAARLSALMKLPVLYVLTHDSIGVGEDGPTHQPVEQLAALRSLPNFVTFRPADGPETAAAYAYAMTHNGPVALVLTRQNLPTLEGSGKGAMQGGYLLRQGGENPDIILMASGSEVQLCLEAADQLAAEGVQARVVSMPSMELFEQQPLAYRQSVLPDGVRRRIAIEAGADFGWHRYTGLDGRVIAMQSFGASGKAEHLFEKFGFTTQNLLQQAREMLQN